MCSSVLFPDPSLPETHIPSFSFLRFGRRETVGCVALMDSAGPDYPPFVTQGADPVVHILSKTATDVECGPTQNRKF